jgi:hypothetical protein
MPYDCLRSAVAARKFFGAKRRLNAEEAWILWLFCELRSQTIHAGSQLFHSLIHKPLKLHRFFIDRE